MVAGQPATDDPGTHRGAHPFAVEFGPKTRPSWRSRTMSAGWLLVLILVLGALAALTIAFVVVVAWAFISSAVG